MNKTEMYIAYNQDYMILFYKGISYKESVDIIKVLESKSAKIQDTILYKDVLGKNMHKIEKDDYNKIFTALFNDELSS